MNFLKIVLVPLKFMQYQRQNEEYSAVQVALRLSDIVLSQEAEISRNLLPTNNATLTIGE